MVEDAAEAHGARYKGKPVGSLGDVGCFSYFQNKILACGEGGSFTTNDDAIAAAASVMRTLGMLPDEWFSHPVVGINARMTNLVAAILCAQLERSDEIVADRRRVYRLYEQALRGIPDVEFLIPAPDTKPAPWFFSITLGASRFRLRLLRDGLIALLRGHGIQTRPFFQPLHEMTALQPPEYHGATEIERGEYTRDRFPWTTYFADAGINLPTHHGIGEEEVERVATVIREHMNQR